MFNKTITIGSVNGDIFEFDIFGFNDLSLVEFIKGFLLAFLIALRRVDLSSDVFA